MGQRYWEDIQLLLNTIKYFLFHLHFFFSELIYQNASFFPPQTVSLALALVWPGTHCGAQTDLNLRTNLTAATQPSVPGVSHLNRRVD